MNQTRNPYSPPLAKVQDPSDQRLRSRPTVVVIAVSLLVIGLLYGGFGLVVMFGQVNVGEASPMLFVFTMARWIVAVLVCVFLWHGRNWARILLLAQSVFGLLMVFFDMSLSGGAMQAVSMLIAAFINPAAALLVYVPGRAWFSKGRRPAN